MATIPYSRVFVGTEGTVAVFGKQICVVNSTTGQLLSSTVKIPEEQGNVSDKTTGIIVAAAVNENFTYLLTAGENKILKLWGLPELKLVNERELPKRPTGLAFTKDSQTILVSDKFGDVFSYPLNYAPPTAKPSRDEFSSHENPSDGQLVLGHASPLNGFLLSHDEKYIITADRDEHIRVSWYPEGCNIETYCLGHRKYVSAICIPEFAPETLISGGGDPSLKIWDWMSGRCIGEVQIWESVEPFVVVKSIKRKRGEEENEDGEDEAAPKRKGKGKKSKRRRNKQNVEPKTEEGEGIEIEMEDGEDNVHGSALGPIEEKVLVVNKIRSTQKGGASSVVFSAVGVSALFSFQYPTGSIKHFDFGYPVIDFTVDEDRKVWVSLDTTWSTAGSKQPQDSRFVRVVQVVDNGDLAEAALTPENQNLLRSLNEAPASPGPVSDKLLDFYADLKALPKWSEPSALALTPSSKFFTNFDIENTEKPLTRREEGRMKNKMHVLAKMQEMVKGGTGKPGEGKEKPGTVRPYGDVDSDEKDTKTKRIKSDVAGEERTDNAGMES